MSREDRNLVQDMLSDLNNLGANYNFEEIFFTSAEKIMNNFALKVGEFVYEFTELEYYFFDAQIHPDPYVHKSYLQLKFGEFYVHEKALNRIGLDITFGNGSSFGGILIRGLQKHGSGYFAGTSNCLKELTKNFNPKSHYCEIQKQTNKLSIIQIKPNQQEILKSKRILSSVSPCDSDEMYLRKCYRFARKDYRSASKGNIEGVVRNKEELDKNCTKSKK